MPSLSLKIVQDDGAVTRKVKFDSRMTVQEAHKVVKEKVIVPDNGKEYALFLRSADSDLTGVWLENDRNLDYYMLRDGDSLDYICKVRNLRVRLLDGTVKTLQVDEANIVVELLVHVCARIGITNYDEYGLCREEIAEDEDGKETKEPVIGTLTRKGKVQQKDRDEVLEQMSKRLKTDDNVEWLDQHRTLRELGIDPSETLLLKRRLFFSDRNVDSRDPMQLNLLYLQTRDAILNGRHPVTEQQELYKPFLSACEREDPTTTDDGRSDASHDARCRSVQSTMFHEKLDIKLIRLVKDNPVLYDFNHGKYMDFNTREVSWQKIGDELRRPAADCKVRWINIRDVHRRILKKNLTEPVHPPRQYKYETEMAFMRPFYRDVIVLSMEEEDEEKPKEWTDMVQEEDATACSDDSDVPIKKVKTKKKKTRKRKEPTYIEEPKQSTSTLNDTQNSELDPTDPVDAFLLSIGATLKTFSPYHLNVAKSKIFAVVQEHDLQQIVQKQKNEHSDVKVSTTETLFLDG